MNWQELVAKLDERDRVEKKLLPYFAAFATASQRASQASNLQSKEDKSVGSTATEQSKESNEDIIERLKESRHELTRQLKTIQVQLDEAQERSREAAEEQYLKTHVVQGLHDEILALTMQLNLSEEKRKKLQDETGR